MYQMTLGELINILKKMPQDLRIYGLGELVSYRPDPTELAFVSKWEYQTAKDLLEVLIKACGKRFLGYKGGRFRMERSTKLFRVAGADMTGSPVIGLVIQGRETEAWILVKETSTHPSNEPYF